METNQGTTCGSLGKLKEACNVCGVNDRRLLRCARCKNVLYCGQQHQKQDWRNHKANCVAPSSVPSTSNDSTHNKHNREVPASRTQTQTTSTAPKNNTRCDTRKTFLADARDGKCTLGGAVPVDFQQDSTKQNNPSGSGSGKTQFIPIYSVRDYDMNIDDYIITPSPARGKPTLDDISHRECILKRADYMVETLNKDGYCVIDSFLGESKCSKVLWDVVSILRAGIMKPGQIVSSVDVKETVRGDKIAWITGSEEFYENMKLIMKEIDRLIRYCAGRLGNIKGRTPAMVACYPGDGTGYKRHIDNTVSDGRKVTCLYYLNKGWVSEEMGGKLRMFPMAGSDKVDVDPISDRLVVFWSDRRTPHEVLPAYHQRFAVTLWYFDADERKLVKDRYFSNLKNAFANSVQVTSTIQQDPNDPSVRVPASSVMNQTSEKVDERTKKDGDEDKDQYYHK